MGEPTQAEKTLKQCLKDAGNNAAAKTACETAYATAVGATTDGGKVFEMPNGDATFVANGGKVFRGGKVF